MASTIKICQTCLFIFLAAYLAGCAATAMVSAPPTAPNNVTPPQALSLGDLVPPQSLPSRDEELWIIEKNDQAPASSAAQGLTGDASELLPGDGTLLNVRGVTLTAIPLKETNVRADIDGCIASVDVRQHFENASKELADVLYEFPLPQNGAVNEFVLSIGKRHIRAIVRERAEAERIYYAARGQRYLASLMVQQSPNVFAQRIANLQPGGQIDVELRYFHTLPYHDGWFEFEFPMVAGLRERGMPLVDQRDGRNITLAVHINAGMPIEDIRCSTHKMVVKTAGNVADATLTPGERIPNRDLVLRYKLAGDEVKSSLITEQDGDGGTFAVLLVPPTTTAKLPDRPLKVIAAIDSSSGKAGVAAFGALMRGISARDTAVSETNDSHDDFLANAFRVPRDPTRLSVICIITDGSGNLGDMFSKIPTGPDAERFVVIGVGPSLHRETIEAIAHVGRGAAVYLPPTENAADDTAASIARYLFERFGHPAVTDIQVDWTGVNATDVFPSPVSDLFVGHPVLLIGRYHGSSPREITLTGNFGDGIRHWTVAARSTELPGRTPLASVWARRKIADLARSAVARPDPLLEQRIRQIALEHGLLSRDTGFITVDALTQAAEK